MSLSLRNTEIGFSSKSDRELQETKWLFTLMNNRWMVSIGSAVTIVALRLHLPIRSIVMGTIYKHFCGGRTLEDSIPTFRKLAKFKILSMVDYSVEAKQAEPEFIKTTEEILSAIRKISDDPDAPINCIKLTGLARFGLLKKINAETPLKPNEESELNRVKQRLESLCKAAAENKVQLYIDAEETWIQDAMDKLVTEMITKYNKDRAVVFNTIQLYRKDRLEYLRSALQKARSEGYQYGVKLVRGAYMEKERKRAIRKGYPSPIQDTKADTDRDYNLALELCIDNLDQVSFCAASHNEESALYLIKLIETKGLPRDHPNIMFAQLYGMSDNISFNLGRAGFNICKYIPYGPVREVVPYLIRRAKENTSIAGQMSRELQLVETEIQRRKAL